MPAATKQPRKKALKKPSAKAAEITDVPTTTMDLPVAAIAACPFQPRQNFPEEEIEQLGQSILADGLIHPIAVRPDPEVDGGYQLVDGERRWRACQWLGRQTIRAEVGQWTDAQVMRIVVASALQRRDLNPIEEALAFQRAIEAGVAAGPTELARQLGVSQGHVSNRIRLLELPDDWKQRVISGEIPPTHARSLIKFRDCPAILARVAEDMADGWSEIRECRCTVDDFEEHVAGIAEDETRPISGTWRDRGTNWKDVPVRQFTEVELAALKPITLDVRSGRGHKEELRATNVELWDKLQAEYLAGRDAAAEKKAEKTAAKKPTKELSPAEKKQQAAEEKRKAKEREKQFQKRLGEWHDHWLRYLIAARLAADSTMQELLVVAAYATTVHRSGAFDPMAGLKDACKGLAPDVEIGTKKGHFGQRLDVMRSLVQLGEDEIEPVLGRTIAKWFWDDGPVAVAYSDDLGPLATYLVIDRQRAWSEDQAGELSLAYWNLHSKEQLLELGKELGVEVEASAKKTDLVDRFMARNDLEVEPLAMPQELQNLKTP